MSGFWFVELFDIALGVDIQKIDEERYLPTDATRPASSPLFPRHAYYIHTAPMRYLHYLILLRNLPKPPAKPRAYHDNVSVKCDRQVL